MGKRLASAGVAIVIGVVLLIVDRKEVLLVAVSALSAIAVYEILIATKYIANRAVAGVSLFFSCAIPFILSYDVGAVPFLNARYVSFAFIIGLFLVMLFSHKKVKFAEVALMSFVSLCVPFSLSCIVFVYDYIGDAYDHGGTYHRLFALFYALTITWISDSGAFFAGTFLGKHKMAPNISPKKTWEGFFGGLATAALFGFLLGFGYERIMPLFFESYENVRVNTAFLAVLAIPCSALGVLGDLSASILKRECLVKDFGNIMPGHGGVLDRFDSVLFVMPFIYLVFIQYFPVDWTGMVFLS